MKFSGKFLTLLSITAALAHPSVLHEKRAVVKLPAECNQKINQIYLSYSKYCNTDIDGMSDRDANMFICDRLNVSKCKELYNISFFKLPECKNTNANVLYRLEHAKKVNIDNVFLRCSKDEKNRNCPLSYSVLDDESIYRTCESKICTSQSIAFFENLDTYNRELIANIKGEETKFDVDPRRQNNVKNYLKSNKCRPQNVPKPTTTTTTVKPKPTTTTTTVKPKPTTTTTTVKPKPTITTTTTTVKPKPTTTTTTTTVEPEPTTTTTTTTVDPEPSVPVVEPTPSASDPEPSVPVVEPTPSASDPEPSVPVEEPTPSASDPSIPVEEPTTSASDPEPSVPVEEPTASVSEPKPFVPVEEPSKPAESSDIENGSDDEPEKTPKRKCFVKHRN
ncbi:hypothetical protein PIROE2DRAFT_13144 [Piromyces sp. E2]|nr:hypothetical protein PIROE2DRAFT_13144 [Piromyces sp. E2]|eukprot:OUM60943.1 hypothetical protein PIROE2DRAFT_13144 [Piromyces sp. E2]